MDWVTDGIAGIEGGAWASRIYILNNTITDKWSSLRNRTKDEWRDLYMEGLKVIWIRAWTTLSKMPSFMNEGMDSAYIFKIFTMRRARSILC